MIPKFYHQSTLKAGDYTFDCNCIHKGAITVGKVYKRSDLNKKDRVTGETKNPFYMHGGYRIVDERPTYSHHYLLEEVAEKLCDLLNSGPACPFVIAKKSSLICIKRKLEKAGIKVFA